MWACCLGLNVYSAESRGVPVPLTLANDEKVPLGRRVGVWRVVQGGGLGTQVQRRHRQVDAVPGEGRRVEGGMNISGWIE